MPKIQTYERRVDNPGVVDSRRMSAEDAGAGEGLASLSRGLATASDVLMQRESQIETSDLSAKIAKLQADKQIEWGEQLRKADPNDRELASRFAEDFDKSFESLGANISTSAGRKFFEERRTQLNAHFQTTTNAGMTELAAVKAGQDFQVELNSYSTSVLGDPTSYDSNIAGLLMGLEARVKSGALPRETAMKLETAARSEIAKNAVQGWIDKDPAFAKSQLDSGKWDTQFDGNVKQQLYGAVDAEVRGREAEAARQRAEQERIVKEAQETTKKGFLDEVQKGTLTWKKISSSNLDASDREHYANLIKSASEKTLKTDYRTFRDVLDRIHLPEGDPRKITDERMITQKTIDGLLDVSDTKFLRDEFAGKNTEAGRRASDSKNAFLQGYKASITKSVVGKNDVDGDMNYAKFVHLVSEKEQQRRKEGKPVEDLYNPTHPDFIGAYAVQFQRSVKQQMNDYSRYMRRPPSGGQDLLAPVSGTPPPKKTKPPREAGESIKDYNKRVGN